MGKSGAAVSAEDAGHGVTAGSLDVELLDRALDVDILLGDQDVGGEGTSAGLLAVSAVADDLRVGDGAGDSDGALAAKAGSGVRHCGE